MKSIRVSSSSEMTFSARNSQSREAATAATAAASMSTAWAWKRLKRTRLRSAPTTVSAVTSEPLPRGRGECRAGALGDNVPGHEDVSNLHSGRKRSGKSNRYQHFRRKPLDRLARRAGRILVARPRTNHYAVLQPVNRLRMTERVCRLLNARKLICRHLLRSFK